MNTRLEFSKQNFPHLKLLYSLIHKHGNDSKKTYFYYYATENLIDSIFKNVVLKLFETSCFFNAAGNAADLCHHSALLLQVVLCVLRIFFKTSLSNRTKSNHLILNKVSLFTYFISDIFITNSLISLNSDYFQWEENEQLQKR